MSLFGKKKKRIINSAIADLRNYSPEALNKIDIITAATVVLPENPTSEFMEAYGSIGVKNIACEISADKDRKLSNLSGMNELNKNNIDFDAVYIASGITVVKSLHNTTPVDMISSGIIVYDSSSNINLISKSGTSVEVDFEFDKTKLFPKDVNINSRFIELIDNAVIVAGGDIYFDNDVSEEIFLSKNIHFVAGKKIICSKKIKSSIQIKSTVGLKYVNE